MGKIKVIIIRTAGTNCDEETAYAFQLAGADAALVHINEVTRGERDLNGYHIMAIPGGFTYGDDIASGKILANEFKFELKHQMRKFVKDGRLIIGICNGFQVLVKSGFLPNLNGSFESIEATLTINDSAKFEDRWVYLKKGARGKGQGASKDRCVWTKGIGDIIYLPVAHGEGKFMPGNRDIMKRLKNEGMIALEYVDENGRKKGYPHNPNGSIDNIAGICDNTGRIFGLMPHPERHITCFQHPRWTRKNAKKEGDGLAIFRNGVAFAKKNL
ncbi:MAG: phosphoribosylformylglycinamidine synthase I [Candidatus Omnitrophica bacterium]|nr:phosphoribosylformylglycinamidine synthase I [Candidatus Omnitrophota bacterium]